MAPQIAHPRWQTSRRSRPSGSSAKNEQCGCLAEKIDRALTFYDFPQEDWSKIRTNNVAEHGCRFIRQRQRPIGAFTNRRSANRILGDEGATPLRLFTQLDGRSGVWAAAYSVLNLISFATV